MDRSPLRRMAGWLTALAILAALGPALGCTSAITTVAYLINGRQTPAEYEGFKGKRVAVVCQSEVQLQYSAGTATALIGAEVSNMLRQNIRKIDVVDQQKIASWVDEKGWDGFTELELGEAMKADLVVALELEGFSLYEGQTLYQGRSQVRMRVYDVAEKKIVFEKPTLAVVYPPNSGRPTSDKSETEFRREFVAVLGDRIARHFYAHDMFADMALDSQALK